MKCESCHNYSYFLWYTDRGVKKVHSCIICEQCNKMDVNIIENIRRVN